MDQIYFAIYYQSLSFLSAGSHVVPASQASRVVAVHWWMFGVLITTLYTANLVAFLSVKSTAPSVNSLEALAESTEYGVVMAKRTALSQLMMVNTMSPCRNTLSDIKYSSRGPFHEPPTLWHYGHLL